MDEYLCFEEVLSNFKELWVEDELNDFLIIAEDTKIKCNKFVLASSSGYFRAMLRSAMRESIEGVVSIPNVSADVLKEIVSFMYSGKVVLTEENFIGIWKLSDQLEINFILKACESFAKKVLSPKNLITINENTKHFQSEHFKKSVFEYLLLAFDALSEEGVFCSFTLKEVLEVINSPNLVTTTEDLVLETIIKWIDTVPVDYCSMDATSAPECVDEKELKTKALFKLLGSVRLALVSLQVLQHVQQHILVKGTAKIEQLILRAIADKSVNAHHGQWQNSAVHRDSSEFIHCGVTRDASNKFIVISASDENTYTCSKNYRIDEDVCLVAFGCNIFAAGCKHASQQNSSLWVLGERAWRKVTDISGRKLIIVPYNDALFIFRKNSALVSKLTLSSQNYRSNEFTVLPNTFTVEYVVQYDKSFLLFSVLQVNEVEKTLVNKLNTLTKKISELDNINGSCEEMVTFGTNDSKFILLKNGDAFKITNSNGEISFVLIDKLWKIERKLNGALTYKDKLIIFGCKPENESPQQILKDQIPGLFNLIKYLGNETDCSNFIPVTLLKKELQEIKK